MIELLCMNFDRKKHKKEVDIYIESFIKDDQMKVDILIGKSQNYHQNKRELKFG